MRPLSENNNKNSLGYLIRQRRLQLKLSQAQLAKKLGLKNAHFISQIECGQKSMPAQTFKNICKILEIKVGE